MFKQNTFSESDLYRGSLPFFLAEEKKGVIFLASSNKNIEDYYYTLKDFYNGEIIKIDDFEDENDEYKKNYAPEQSVTKYVLIIFCFLSQIASTEYAKMIL